MANRSGAGDLDVTDPRNRRMKKGSLSGQSLCPQTWHAEPLPKWFTAEPHRLVADGLDADPVIVEDGSSAHVGVAFVHGGVDVDASAVELWPVALDGSRHAGADPVADLSGRDK